MLDPTPGAPAYSVIPLVGWSVMLGPHPRAPACSVIPLVDPPVGWSVAR